jgi:hypothetical protein
MLFAAQVATTHKALANLDLAIIGVYFLIVFGIGFYFSRRERTSEEYFLAGRDVGWFFIGASLFVSNISTEHFIGLSGTGASSGLAVGHFEWLACLILLILGWVFVPFYLRSNVFTMPQFLERRFSRQCAVYLAGISIIAYIFTKISVQLYAASVVLERVAGWSLWKTAVVLVVATGDLHDRGRIGCGDLHRHGADTDFDYRRGRADLDRLASRRRLFAPAEHSAGKLLSYDEARDGFGVSLDGNIFWRADFRNLVLVHGPGDRTTRAFRAR